MIVRPEKYSLAVALMATSCAVPAQAASLDVLVLDPDGAPVANVAVFVEQAGIVTDAPAVTAIMDQIDTQFVPHMLVVRRGTMVEFPNSDIVAHHVYSFSKPNNFVLPLYKGNAHEPITFEYPGVVTLGCNIHDGMLGYVVVVDTAVFGLTDAAGRISLQIDDRAAAPVVNIWSPRLRDEQSSLRKTAVVVANSDTAVSFQLHKKLRPPHDEQSGAVQWSDY